MTHPDNQASETIEAVAPDTGAVPKKRTRLSPELRRQQILDAALVEFSAEGFGGTSIANIARRAGMSKGNIFVHFSSKEEVFVSLIKSVLDPEKAQWGPIDPGRTLEEHTDAFIDVTYDELTPKVVSIIRLMIAEGHRVPDLMDHWYKEAIVPAHEMRRRVVQGYVDEGVLERTALTSHFDLIMAPVLYAAIFKMVFSKELADAEVQNIKETHRRLLRTFLKG